MQKELSAPVVVKEKEATTEIIFRYVCLLLVFVLLFCIPGFLSFKGFATTNGLHFISAQSWWWCLLGFVVYGSVKYTYFALIKDKIYSILHPKFAGEERDYRMKQVSKLSFDTVFYSCASFTAYYLFHQESWFPSAIGGEGQCSLIYRDYPNWPKETSHTKIQIFYMVQLGINFFSIYETFAIKRKSDRKFYEFLLHHFMATSLILFSMLTNNLAVGITILFIHNFSDVTGAFVRALVETKYKNVLLHAFFWVIAVINWGYMRIVAFPSCLIKAVYDNIPDSNQPHGLIHFPMCYLISLLVVLVSMHIFWFYFLVKTGIMAALGQSKTNAHDQEKIKQ